MGATVAYFQATLRASAHRPPEVLRDLCRGVLMGLAVGNALGIPVEGLPRSVVRRRFPNGLRDISPAERERPWDDDLAQAVVLAQACLERGELDLADVASRLLRWARANGRGMGVLTSQVIGELAAGTPPQDAALVVWERGGRTGAGNGAVMRCAPVALRWRTAPSRLIVQSRMSAVVTHYDPRCVWSTIALNLALALCLGGGTLKLPELAAALEAAGAPTTVLDAIRSVEGSTLEVLDLDGPDMGYTLKTMQVGLWAFQQDRDLETVLVEVVNAGGDTDTNGAVAGSVMGARVGFSGIPPRWIERIREAEALILLADGLLELSRSAGEI